MSNGIAVLVFLKDGKLIGLCTGISNHDELCKIDEDLCYGKIEPYRFELLYPCNLRYDRSLNLHDGIGIAREQPSHEIWEIAFEVAKPFFMKHNLKQLQFANLRGASLTNANLNGANLRDADLRDADFKCTNLRDANLKGADCRGTNFRDANLINVNLKDANLRGANLTNANLTDANLIGTELTGANLLGANGI